MNRWCVGQCIALFMGLLILTSCSLGQKNTEVTQNSQTVQNTESVADSQSGASGGEQVIGILNKKCEKAISRIELMNWDKPDIESAKKACQIYDKYLCEHEMDYYDMVEFVTQPAKSYYFMIAYLERELASFGVIDIERGEVITGKEGIAEFVKNIRVLDSNYSALQLANMIHCFHAGDAMRLVTSHQDGDEWRAEQNAPELTKSDDGSMKLVYDLHFTGRGFSVEQCTLNVSADYQVTFNCEEKRRDREK